MSDIISCLCKLGFNRLEAQIYVALLEGGEMSGYQIAKKINISRSSVYAALEHMYERGAVLLMSESVQVYKAQNPDVLFSQLKDAFSDNAEFAALTLRHLYENRHEDRFTNIKGFETVVSSAKEMLKSAKKEVYMNTDFNLRIFAPEFKMLRKSGVRIIVFSFAKLDSDGLGIEFFTHNDPVCDEEMPSRIMLVADCTATLVADICKKSGEWFGTVTNNELMVSIAAEHIHNDIYLLKLKEKYGSGLISDDIKLSTMLESR